MEEIDAKTEKEIKELYEGNDTSYLIFSIKYDMIFIENQRKERYNFYLFEQTTIDNKMTFENFI